MKRCKLKTIGRKKALFGSESAAILAAAGIGAAATTAGAALGAKAQRDASREQARAITQNSIKQSQALLAQNKNAKEIQEQQQEFTRNQNEEQNQVFKDMNMNLQYMAGVQNTNDRIAASNIVVRNGGSLKTKYPVNGNVPLRGGLNTTNMPFVVTDGGGVVPMFKTKEGYDVYQILGNDHEHKHKIGNRRKLAAYGTGVGFKFANGGVIEGEGNQNSNLGELLMVTPNDAMFISKHDIKGFNPAKSVINGMDPVAAFNIQQNIKQEYGISDSGRHSAKCGGKVRAKRDNGGWANFYGAGIGALGNFGGALINYFGNNAARRYITQANNTAAGIMANAYSKMKGIDLNSIKRDDYQAAHAMAAVRAPIINANPELTKVERARQRSLDRADKYSLSGAAINNRAATTEANAYDQRSGIYGNANKLSEQIKQHNADLITQVANENANRDIQSMQNWSRDYLQGIMYNNNIRNQQIAGIGQVTADANINNAQASANAAQSTAQGFASALSSTAQGIGNAITANAKYQHDKDMALLGADRSTKVDYYTSLKNPSKNERAEARRMFDSLINSSAQTDLDNAQKLSDAFGFFQDSLNVDNIPNNPNIQRFEGPLYDDDYVENMQNYNKAFYRYGLKNFHSPNQIKKLNAMLIPNNPNIQRFKGEYYNPVETYNLRVPLFRGLNIAK